MSASSHVAVAAIGSAAIAGLVVAVACMSARVPAATTITLTFGAATATFGAVVALAALAASLFFGIPEGLPPGGPASAPPSAS
jgi:hypothetical protein